MILNARYLKIKVVVLASVLSQMLISCNSNRVQGSYDNKVEKVILNENIVTTVELNRSDFNKELICNGKLKALYKSDLFFNTAGKLQEIFVKNGTRVTQGDTIASLFNTEIIRELELAQSDLVKSKLNLDDVLIGLGFNPSDILSISEDKLKLAEIKSGYSESLSRYNHTIDRLSDCHIIAPFDGLIANVEHQKYEQINDQFCTLINDSEFEVKFEVMESEYADIKISQEVDIYTFTDNENKIKGYINEINPIVDKSGLIRVTALIENSGQIIDGMNVSVVVKNTISEQFVVPKSAVLLRDNKYVLFKVVNHKAFWTYVDVVDENSDSYVVVPNLKKSSASLNVGDSIIVTGNLNLAHESKITIRQ